MKLALWRSLRFRLLAAVILVLVIAVAVTALVASQRTTGEFQRYVEDLGDLRYGRFAGILSRVYETTRSWQAMQREVQHLSEITDQRVVVADATGRIVADSGGDLIGDAVAADWPAPAAPIVAWGQPVGFVWADPLSGASEADRSFVAAVNRSVGIGALAAGLVAVVVALVIAAAILRPVRRLTEAAQRMEKGDLGVRVDVRGDDEISRLGHAFNAMAGGLAQQEVLRRNMVNDVAHELRTPLTNLRGYLEAARDGLVQPDAALVDNLYEETMLLSRIVADLQELSVAEAGQLKLQRAATGLAALLEQAVAVLRPQAEARGVTLAVQLPPDLPPADIDPGRIGQVVRNLLNNAVAHTPAGGRVTVSAEARDGELAVRVSDTGAGIPPEHLPHVFERFYRADMSRTRQTGGAGLGLAIVRQLVLAHGGAVSAESRPGQGSTFTFTVPVYGPSTNTTRMHE